ncbi:MAG: ABC transporter substrate-binding protein [Actinomycetota bacterium]
MRRYLRVLALVAVMGLVAAACGGDDDGGEGATGATGTGATGGTATGATGADITPGGTFEAALLSDVTAGFDPQKEYYAVAWAFYRCCLARTLMSYDPNDPDSTHLVPDLAAAEPEISADGLTWVFTIRDGVTFGPPYEDVEVTAQDFIRAFERTLTPEVAAGYYFYYLDTESQGGIVGSSDFYNGDADSIEGLVAVDDKTLEVHLNRPAGDLGYRMAMPATAPIPEGASENHVDDYGRFLVSTGPYMFEGSEQITDDTPAAGYEPGQAITLVRNPSWDEATDPIRKAYVDRIEVAIGGTAEDNQNKIDAGELDVEYDGIPPAEAIRAYSTDPELQGRIYVNSADGTRFLWMNLGVPPFDDLAVRRAVNFAVDRDGMRRLRGGETVGDIATHMIIPSLLGGNLEGYDPFATPNSAGDIEAAKAEMANSKYDSDGDGVCDDPVCENVLFVTDEASPYPEQAALIQDNLEPLGITLDVKAFERSTMYNKYFNPEEKVAFGGGAGWFKDYADAYSFVYPLFYGPNILDAGNTNYPLLGADPDQLEKYGYTDEFGISEVPSLDEKAEECFALTDAADRTTCFAELDQILTEEIAAYVPFLWDNDVTIISERVVNYVYSGFDGLMALDQVALADGGA